METAIYNIFGKCNMCNIDIREDSLAEIKGDYLKMDVKKFNPQVIITNHPFSLAVPIIEKALDDVEENGYAKRGSTDSIEYSHFVFRKGYKPNYTKLVLI